MANLTSKEQQLLNAIKDGMDDPGCGWLHEVNPFGDDHVAAGVVGALVKKGLITSHKEKEPGCPPIYWLSLV